MGKNLIIFLFTVLQFIACKSDELICSGSINQMQKCLETEKYYEKLEIQLNENNISKDFIQITGILEGIEYIKELNFSCNYCELQDVRQFKNILLLNQQLRLESYKINLENCYITSFEELAEYLGQNDNLKTFSLNLKYSEILVQENDVVKFLGELQYYDDNIEFSELGLGKIPQKLEQSREKFLQQIFQRLFENKFNSFTLLMDNSSMESLEFQTQKNIQNQLSIQQVNKSDKEHKSEEICDQSSYEKIMDCIDDLDHKSLKSLVISSQNISVSQMNKFNFSKLGKEIKKFSNLEILEFDMQDSNLYYAEGIDKSFEGLEKLKRLVLNFSYNKFEYIEIWKNTYKNFGNLEELIVDFSHNQITYVEQLKNLLQYTTKLKILSLNFYYNDEDLYLVDNLQEALDEQIYSTVTDYSQILPYCAQVYNFDLTSLRKDGQRQYLDIASGDIKDCNNTMCYNCFDTEYQCDECLNKELDEPYCYENMPDTDNCNQIFYSSILECIDNVAENQGKSLIVSGQNLLFGMDFFINFQEIGDKISKITTLEHLTFEMNQLGLKSIEGISKSFQGLQQLKSVIMKFEDNKITSIDVDLQQIISLENLQVLQMYFKNNKLSNLNPGQSNLRILAKTSNNSSTSNLNTVNFDFNGNNNLDAADSLQNVLDSQEFYETVTNYSQHIPDGADMENVDLTSYSNGETRQYVDLKTGEVKDCSNKYCKSCFEKEGECSECLDSSKTTPGCTNKKSNSLSPIIIVIIVLAVILILAGMAFAGYKYWQHKKQNRNFAELAQSYYGRYEEENFSKTVFINKSSVQKFEDRDTDISNKQQQQAILYTKEKNMFNSDIYKNENNSDFKNQPQRNSNNNNQFQEQVKKIIIIDTPQSVSSSQELTSGQKQQQLNDEQQQQKQQEYISEIQFQEVDDTVLQEEKFIKKQLKEECLNKQNDQQQQQQEQPTSTFQTQDLYKDSSYFQSSFQYQSQREKGQQSLRIAHDYDNIKFYKEKYDQLGLLGQGNFGVVFKVQNKETKEFLAAKMIHVYNDEDFERALIEVKILRQIVTKNESNYDKYLVLAKEIYVDEEDYTIVLLFELAKNNFAQLIQYQIKKYQKIPKSVIYNMIYHSLMALRILQKDLKIYHRDIKPENILVFENNRFKLSDFGASKKILQTQFVRTQTLTGTPNYMAPEIMSRYQKFQNDEIDNIDDNQNGEQKSFDELPFKADIFSLGLSILQAVNLLSDDSLWKLRLNSMHKGEERIKVELKKLEYNPQYPNKLAKILEKMLKFDPDDRDSINNLLQLVQKYKHEFE